MISRESGPVTDRTARRLADAPNVHRTAVVSVRLTDDWHTQRSVLAEIASLAPFGAHVRLRLGISVPAPWVADFIRADLRYQLESSDVRTIARWNSAFDGRDDA